MSDLIENLKKLEVEYQKVLNEIGTKLRDIEEIPKAKALVGKYFKYANSYGHGTKWWMYTRVIGFKDTEVTSDQFQEDSNGKIEFTYDEKNFWQIFDNSNYIPIDEKEYYIVYNELVAKVTNKSKRSK